MAVAAEGGSGDYVGTTACGTCHPAQLEAWRGSHHDRAMQHADADTVLGDFGDATVTYGTVTSTFFRRDGGFFVRTDGPDGKLADYPIAYTFGVDPLQQYLVAMPGGRLQALGIAWDSRPVEAGGQRWFHLYPDDRVDHEHELHWTRSQQNWNYMCAGCHSTNLQKGYDAETGRFATAWSDIDVGCEACHGPGSAHLAWAGLDAESRARDASLGLVMVFAQRAPWRLDAATGSARPHTDDDAARAAAAAEIGVCADCHSRRGQIAEGAGADARFLDHFMPALLTDGLYYADGQIEDEVFVWGSFTQSRMHQAGVRCSDCHEPHALTLRAPGDAVCAQCHQPTRFAAASHHHHEPGSPGSSCVACHMPATTYMLVDPRRDHSLRIPRPDRTVALGIPNACNGCHAERSAEWAADRYGRWYPEAGAGQQVWADAFSAARAGDPRAADDLVALLESSALPAIARATAMLELQPFLDQRRLTVLERAAVDPEPLVRIAALRGIEALPPAQRFAFAGPALDDELLAVRAEAGRVLAALPEASIPPPQRDRWRRAVADYEATQTFNADRAEAQTNLGSLYAQRGDIERADAAFARAIALDPGYPPAYANEADLLRSRGDDEATLAVLARGISACPDAAALYHARGLAQVRTGDRTAALESLRTAARLDPDTPRFAYVLAVAESSAGDPDAARATLQSALERHPYDRDLLFALASMAGNSGDLQTARNTARRMLELRPTDDQALQLARALGLL